ncbi:Alpha/Beta hydrolase protein [Stachybotrys elegans]|uniref:Alpha/Beta hydrolase protein n=1 Tax=Stachybotrys elegans TaxID=80388 RepID=A0A8K0SNV8_9HYPO|nr:Alpha/Beta hydrolase protein [Stachybotrys elegans]
MFNFYYTWRWLAWTRPTDAPRPPPAGLERHWVDTPGGRLEILHARPARPSKTPPLFFMHGGMGSAWVWADYMRFCASEGIPCYAISIRGHGDSWHPSYLRMVYGTSRRMLADDLVAGIRWVQDREDSEVVLVGHSSGGGLGQDVLSQGLVTVKGLALLGAVPAFGSMGVYMNWARVDPWFLIRMLLHGWHPNSPLSHPMLIKRIFFGEDIGDAQVAEFQAHVNRYEAFWWPITMMTAFADPRRILRHIQNDSDRKVLVLTGTEDKLMTAPIMERLGAFYREAARALWAGKTTDDAAEVSFVPRAGHHLQNDTTWEIGAKKLVEFYRQL